MAPVGIETMIHLHQAVRHQLRAQRPVSGELTDPGIKFLAANRHLTLRGLPMDGQGLIPEALEAICRSGPLRAVICCPNHQSPTLTVMPVERRQAIAAIVVKHDLILIEDDVYGGFLEAALPSISSFAPGCFLRRAVR